MSEATTRGAEAAAPAAGGLVRAAATVGSLTLLSRVLGFVRDAMIAATLGATHLADAFFVSFKLANLLRRLFAEGAFNAGFVPLFARTLEGEGADAARRFAQDTLAVMTVLLIGVVVVAELAMFWLVRGLASGFEPGSERFAAAVELSRISFPYLALISLAALFSGVLNAIGRFWVAAFAPVLLNLVLIAALVLAALVPGAPAHVLAAGVTVAGVLQLALVARACRRYGYALRLRRPRMTPALRRLGGLILPGVAGAGVYQLNLVVDTWFASHLEVGAVSWLFYADRLVQLPLGLIGVALGTVLLPLLARRVRAGEDDAARLALNRAIEYAMLLTLPAAVGLAQLAAPVVSVLFERGAFGPTAAAATAAALAAFAAGLPAYVLIKVLAPAYFAREDTRTPVLVAAICLVVNVLAILALVDRLGHVGIAFATTLASWTNALLLGVVLVRRRALAPDRRLLGRLGAIAAASLAMSAALALAAPWAAALPDAPALALLIALGVAVYLGAALVAGAFRLHEIRAELVRPRA